MSEILKWNGACHPIEEILEIMTVSLVSMRGRRPIRVTMNPDSFVALLRSWGGEGIESCAVSEHRPNGKVAIRRISFRDVASAQVSVSAGALLVEPDESEPPLRCSFLDGNEKIGEAELSA